MLTIKTYISKWFLSLPRIAKKTLLIIFDFFCCYICVVGAFYLRLDEFFFFSQIIIKTACVSFIMALPVFWFSGIYQLVLRYSLSSVIYSILMATLIYGVLFFFVIIFYRIEGFPRSVGILQPFLLFFAITGSRVIVKFIFTEASKKKIKFLKKSLIYGAGNAGQQLAQSLRNSFEYEVLGFLDNNNQLIGQTLEGLPIYSDDNLENIIQKKEIKFIFIATPTISYARKKQILKKLFQYKLTIYTLPTMQNIVDGKVTISDVKEFNTNDILGREEVMPNKELLFKNIKDKVVLVTGAGGSIGSELCRQIFKCEFRTLILCELNEFALFKIHEELKLINEKFKVIPLLVNIQDEKKINEILKIFKVQTIYHAAAYKHVPLVETNICEGTLNNVYGTYAIAKASIQQGVSNFVLISSDKAVRPTNIMGVTKRLSELCLQGLYNQNQNLKINMSIVRFGNVLESSGSVLPKFKLQIKQGGPITLTHPEVTRYFMTISEAAQLVIQAGAISEACEVFVLDMGKSIKIRELIDRIINLSGLSIKDENNPDGDIEIKIIGLRPGEKLFEELLLGEDIQLTKHEKIKKSNEPYIPFDQLKKDLDALKLLLINNKAKKVKEMLEKIVPSYKSEYEIVDYITKEQEDLMK